MVWRVTRRPTGACVSVFVQDMTTGTEEQGIGAFYVVMYTFPLSSFLLRGVPDTRIGAAIVGRQRGVKEGGGGGKGLHADTCSLVP